MYSGRLDQKIEFYSHAETNDGGALTPVYTLDSTVWGHVISQRGNEAFNAARVNAKDTIRVLLRYRADVNSKWRIRWLGQDYNIVNTDRSQHREGQLWITAVAVGAL